MKINCLFLFAVFAETDLFKWSPGEEKQTFNPAALFG
jgi:hypothetical protein